MAGKSEAPKVKIFACLQCGQPVTLRGLLQTTSVVCSSCGTVIDVSDENMQIISAVISRVKLDPDIPIGTRGKLRDGEFEVIGFMRRVIFVEGVGYRWWEYLLFNPFKGFRWLSEYNGHWSYIKTALHRPRIIADGSAAFKGTVFQHFQSALAKVEYVEGEFYWQVQEGEECLVQDFVAPPQILSMEQTGNEITWSLGEYIEPEAIAAAFKGVRIPARIGVGVNQPSPHGDTPKRLAVLAVLFMAIALVIQLASVALSQNKLVFQDSFAYNTTEPEKSRVTDIFEVTGKPSNVVVKTHAGVHNNWIYLNMALINDETGTAYDFGREIGYYSGTDSDGAWTEGSQDDAATILRVQPGRYYLRVEPEGPDPIQYSIRIFRDVPNWLPFLLTLLALGAIPFAVWWRSHTFEYKRWSESDHPMTSPLSLASSDDDE